LFGDISLQNGAFTLTLVPDSIYSITTTSGQSKGQVSNIPSPQIFPLPHSESFETYPVESEAKYFADQTGTFAIYLNSEKRSQTLRQVVVKAPIHWCGESSGPITFIGDASLEKYNVSVELYLETGANAADHTIVGGFVSGGGCAESYSNGYFLNFYSDGSYALYAGNNRLQTGPSPFTRGVWHTALLSLSSGRIQAYLDGQMLCSVANSEYKKGYAILGCGFGFAQFDNFKIY